MRSLGLLRSLGTFATLTVGLALACSSSDDEADDGASATGTGGTLVAGTGGAGAGSAVDPAPLPPEEADGWIDIDSATRSAMTGDACDGWSVEPETMPSVLVFVLDVSGTMNGTTADTGDQTKWEVSRDALLTSLDALPEDISVGLTFYPNMDNGGAVAEPFDHTPCIDQGDNVAPALLGPLGSAQRQALVDALGAVDPEPDGATPTHDALNVAYDLVAADPSGLERYVVLITDGEPTLAEGCFGMAAPRQPDDPTPIIAEMAERLATSAIKTFVVGSPGSEVSAGNGADVRDWLSAAARAGGTDAQPCADSGDPRFCHFDLTQADDFGAALSGALQTIGDWVLSCEYVLPAVSSGGGVIDPNLVNIIYTDAAGQSHLLLPNGDPACAVGWHYADDAHTQIAICGGTCEALKSDGQAALDLVYGCTTGEVPEIR